MGSDREGPRPMYVELDMDFRLEASHVLPRAPDGSPCRRLHGHSFRVDVHVAGEVDPETGWLIDYHEIEAAWKSVHDALDHRHLNDIEGLENPTSEMLAAWIWDHLAPRLDGLLRVTVHETCTARCSYYGPSAGGQEG